MPRSSRERATWRDLTRPGAAATGFLALGASLNILVAWACVIWSRGTITERPLKHWPAPTPEWPTVVPTPANPSVFVRFGVTESSVRAEPLWPVRRSHDALDDADESEWLVYQATLAAGLPWRSVRTVIHCTNRDSRTYPPLVPRCWFEGLPIPEWLPGRRQDYSIRALPIAPMPFGLASNTLVYATGLAAVFHGPRVLRQLLHRRKGCCRACGYDLTGNTTGVCPECGHGQGH